MEPLVLDVANVRQQPSCPIIPPIETVRAFPLAKFFFPLPRFFDFSQVPGHFHQPSQERQMIGELLMQLRQFLERLFGMPFSHADRAQGKLDLETLGRKIC